MCSLALPEHLTGNKRQLEALASPAGVTGARLFVCEDRPSEPLGIETVERQAEEAPSKRGTATPSPEPPQETRSTSPVPLSLLLQLPSTLLSSSPTAFVQLSLFVSGILNSTLSL